MLWDVISIATPHMQLCYRYIEWSGKSVYFLDNRHNFGISVLGSL